MCLYLSKEMYSLLSRSLFMRDDINQFYAKFLFVLVQNPSTTSMSAHIHMTEFFDTIILFFLCCYATITMFCKMLHFFSLHHIKQDLFYYPKVPSFLRALGLSRCCFAGTTRALLVIHPFHLANLSQIFFLPSLLATVKSYTPAKS